MINYIEDLLKLHTNDLKMLCDTLTAWLNNGLPEGFTTSGMRLAKDKTNDCILLAANDKGIFLRLNNKCQLERFYILPFCGDSGFLAELIQSYIPEELHTDDEHYLLQAADEANFNLPESWLPKN